jgi:tetratricopeptide (TPR) repeat protein
MNTKEKVLVHKGMDMVRRMQYEEAIAIFDRVLCMNDQIPEAWNNKGVALFRLGRGDEAIECCERALAIDNDNLEALRNKGFILRSQGRLDEALLCYDALLQKGGEATDMESMATVFVAMGRLEEALDCLYQAMETSPTERFEEEIELLKGMILERDGLVSRG